MCYTERGEPDKKVSLNIPIRFLRGDPPTDWKWLRPAVSRMPAKQSAHNRYVVSKVETDWLEKSFLELMIK